MVMIMSGEMRLGESTGVGNPQRDATGTQRRSPDGRETNTGKGRVQEKDDMMMKKTDM